MSKARQLADLGGDTANLEDISSVLSSGPLSNRNLIINGAMQVAQRGTSATGVTTTDGYYTCDRWKTQTDTGTWTLSQSTDAPNGFGYSYKMQCTSAGTSNADEVVLRQDFEGQTLQQLAFGTASAKQITVSFWIKTNQTGTYALNLLNIDPATPRSVTKTYTVSAADTWEYKTLSFSGDTSQGFDNDNAASLRVYLWFGAASGFTSGTVNTDWETASTDANRVNSDIPGLGGSTSDYVNITGVQLEVGDTATPFEHRSYGQELALCQRYYRQWNGSDCNNNYTRISQGNVGVNSSQVFVSIPLEPEMRAKPTVGNFGPLAVWNGSSIQQISSYSIDNANSSHTAAIVTNGGSISTSSHYQFITNASSTAFFLVDAEL